MKYTVERVVAWTAFKMAYDIFLMQSGAIFFLVIGVCSLEQDIYGTVSTTTKLSCNVYRCSVLTLSDLNQLIKDRTSLPQL